MGQVSVTKNLKSVVRKDVGSTPALGTAFGISATTTVIIHAR